MSSTSARSTPVAQNRQEKEKSDLGAAEPKELLKIAALIAFLALLFYIGSVFFPEPLEPLKK
jgi:hypothetical protein